MKNVLIIGATSAIAEEVARLYATRGCRLYLLARNEERLDLLAKDLAVRGATGVTCHAFEAADLKMHRHLVATAFSELGIIDVILVAFGSLPCQEKCEEDVDTAVREFTINATATISILGHIAKIILPQRQGTIAVISSVAGERGRQSNFLYGSAKAAVTVFSEGLRNRLFKSDIHVVTIQPGFIDTPMTAHFKKGMLWALPSKAARDIYAAIEKGKNVTYVPWFWSPVMWIIRAIPEFIFKRLPL